MADFNFTQTGQELQSDINLVENGIGDAFSTSQTYAVGDYVIYNDKLWKCSTAVSSAGAWTGITNWTETKITDELGNSGGGGTQLYKHTIVGGTSNVTSNTIIIINNSSTPITSQTLLSNILSSITLYLIDSQTDPSTNFNYYFKVYFSELVDAGSSLTLYLESTYDDGVATPVNIEYDLQDTIIDTVTAL